MAETTRVVLADDDVLLRAGLASLLEGAGFEVVGQAGDGEQLISLVRAMTPEPRGHRHPDATHQHQRRPGRRQADPAGIAGHRNHGAFRTRCRRRCDGPAGAGDRIGYLLKSRITDVADFIDSLERVARGASVVDPALVAELVSARRRDDPLSVLSERESEVLALMAEGRSNAGIAHRIWVTEGTVEKHIRSIMNKLSLPETGEDHRRVLAVLAFLDAR